MRTQLFYSLGSLICERKLAPRKYRQLDGNGQIEADRLPIPHHAAHQTKPLPVLALGVSVTNKQQRTIY